LLQGGPTGFSGYAGNAPSGLQYAAPPPGPAPQPFPGYAGSAPSGPNYAEPVQPPDHAPAPQAAYPDPGLSLWPDELPGYLKPYPPPGGFSGRGPAVAAVVIFTLLFGVFGLISASRRAKRAEAAGDSPGRYWMAFGVTLNIGWVVDPTGAGNYKCAVTLADTTRATVLVHAGTAGWRILGQAK
jgi:hypothetical protein